ncbi:MAG: ethanolamine utilization protein EutM [Caldiserica bacterium]|nr:MAG: ethanolamine utilization protein EutM [Caldisericota bacterium]
MEAIGMIETRGLVGVIEAADAMVKAAPVEIVNYEKIGGAFTTVVVKGSVSACYSAVEAGARVAARIGELVSCHVIPQPYDEVGIIFNLK